MDSQQRTVYKWESQWLDWGVRYADRRLVVKTIRDAERLYRVRHAHVQFRKRAKNKAGSWLPSQAEWRDGAHYIALRPQHCNVASGLHEVSHTIIDALFGPAPEGIEDHGPQWLGVYMYLLERFRVAPAVALHASAREAGLRWASPGRVGPHAIRKTYRRRIRDALLSP